MDHLGVGGEGGQFAGHPVVEAHTHGDQQVAVADGPVGIRGAVHARHVEAERMVVGYGAPAHQGRGDGGVDFFRQGQQLRRGIAVDHAPAHVQNGFFGLGDQFRRFFHIARIDFPVELVAPDVHLIGIDKFLHLGLGDVAWHVDQHRPRAARGGDMESLPHDSGQIFRIAGLIGVLDDGHGDAHDVRLLKGVAADGEGGNLAGDGHDGDGV